MGKAGHVSDEEDEPQGKATGLKTYRPSMKREMPFVLD